MINRMLQSTLIGTATYLQRNLEKMSVLSDELHNYFLSFKLELLDRWPSIVGDEVYEFILELEDKNKQLREIISMNLGAAQFITDNEHIEKMLNNNLTEDDEILLREMFQKLTDIRGHVNEPLNSYYDILFNIFHPQNIEIRQKYINNHVIEHSIARWIDEQLLILHELGKTTAIIDAENGIGAIIRSYYLEQ